MKKRNAHVRAPPEGEKNGGTVNVEPALETGRERKEKKDGKKENVHETCGGVHPCGNGCSLSARIGAGGCASHDAGADRKKRGKIHGSRNRTGAGGDKDSRCV